MKVGAVLLASGAGRRFGSNKLLAEWEGLPLICRAMDAITPSLFCRAAVCSPYSEILTLAQAHGFLPLYNPAAEEGISASIRLGLAHMQDMDGVLFAVCDQPRITTDSISRIVNSFLDSPDSIIALSWRGKRGNPVLFPKSCYPALSVLTGDTGGGAVLRQYPDRLRLVEAGFQAELSDVDTPEDLS